jgi:hypothetical protein
VRTSQTSITRMGFDPLVMGFSALGVFLMASLPLSTTSHAHPEPNCDNQWLHVVSGVRHCTMHAEIHQKVRETAWRALP